MEKKMWRGVFIPTIIAVQVVIIILILSSAKTENNGHYENTVIHETKTVYGAVEIPEFIEFAGEKLPLENFWVKESLDRELLSNAYFHSQTIRYLKLAPRYFPIIEPILKEKGVPDDFKYLAVAESGFNPRAVSPANAVGFWQFLKGTAQEYGLIVTNEVDERYHIKKSTYAACDYLLDSYKRYNNWALVAASFNGGVTGVNRRITQQKNDSYYDLLFGEETGRYVYRIVALKLIMENPVTYNFEVSDEEKYPVIKTREVEISSSVSDFAAFAMQQGINYKLLKDFNPWLRENTLTLSGGKKYVVEIPILP
jgi:membrane-bound lytic murein transglycosylase D